MVFPYQVPPVFQILDPPLTTVDIVLNVFIRGRCKWFKINFIFMEGLQRIGYLNSLWTVKMCLGIGQKHDWSINGTQGYCSGFKFIPLIRCNEIFKYNFIDFMIF